MRYVLDASVALSWVIFRPLTPKAVRLRAEHQRRIHELLAPVVFLDEVAGALTSQTSAYSLKSPKVSSLQPL